MLFGSYEGGTMARKNYTTEQLIHLLREAEVEIAKGVSAKEVVRKLGTSE
jgi:hypothetical protein